MSNLTRKSKRAEFDFSKRVTAKNLRALHLFHPSPQAFVRNCMDWLAVQAPKKKAPAPAPAPAENASSQNAPSGAGSGG